MKIHSKLYILLIYIITLNCSPEAEAIGNNKKESTENSPRFIVSTDIETFLNDGTKIIKVVNLNTSGVGSLKSALETPGKRIIIFEIGGVLDLNMTTLEINDPFVTIAGQTAPPGRRMGHAGAIVGGADDTAAAKMKIMRECGITVVESPAEIGAAMAKLLS